MFFKLALLVALTKVVHLAPTVQPCSTESCNEAADYMRSAMNLSENPCQNFYEYSCGGWLDRTVLPEQKSETNPLEILNERTQNLIMKELYSINSASRNQSQVVRFVSVLLQRCLQVSNQSSEFGWKSIEELYLRIFEGIDDNVGWDNQLAFTWTRARVSTIFELAISQDSRNHSNKMFFINPANFGLLDDELSKPEENKELLKAYKNYMTKVAKLMCDHSKIWQANKNCNLTKIQMEVDSVISLEQKLSKIKLPEEMTNNPDVIYNKFTLDRLENKTNFNWKNLFKKIFAIAESDKQVNGDFEVIVTDVEYVIKAIEILKQTDQRTITSYFAWQIVSYFGGWASEEYRAIEFEFNRVNIGINEQSTRQKSCEIFVNNKFGIALSNLFIKKHFSENDKTVAANMIETIQRSYEEIIQNNTWLDATTKAEAIHKLLRVKKNIAYPNWILNDSQIDEYYAIGDRSVMHLNKKPFLIAFLELRLLSRSKSLQDFNRLPDFKERWPMPASLANAAYNPFSNEITIPAAILKPPFFDSKRPPSLNYGSVGMAIGHEFTHGFDDQGSKFDSNGIPNNWWTESSRAGYTKRASCFVEHYSSKIEPTTGLNLNGKSTLGENIADFGGVKQAYYAFKKIERIDGKMVTLSGLPQFTTDQLFFISFGQFWCAKIRKENLKSFILYNPHTLPKFRVEVPLYNSDAFRKAFHCPSNGQDNCEIW